MINILRNLKKKYSSKKTTYLWDEVLERVHDLARLGLLVVLEDAGNNDHGGQHNTEVQVVHVGVVDGGRLEAVGEEAEDGSDPEEG